MIFFLIIFSIPPCGLHLYSQKPEFHVMIHQTDLGWELIEQDPLLRLELSSIEQHTADEKMVAELLEFFTRIDRMIRLTAAIVEEEDGRR